MKILMLTPWYPDKQKPNHGTFIQQQAKALSGQHKVVVIACKVDYTTKGFLSYRVEECHDGNLKEFRIFVPQSFPFYNQLNHLLVAIWQSLRIAKILKPNIIHASIGYPGAFWGATLSRLIGIPFVFTEHTRVTNNFRSYFHKRTTLWGLTRASHIMAVSEHLAKELRYYTRRPVVVVPNMVNVSAFENVKSSLATTPQIGFLGGLNTPVKGLDILLKAVSKLSDDFVLHIGGSGVLVQEYKKLSVTLGIESRCRFYGFIAPEYGPEFMAHIHFFVCASRYETFCIVLIEAMASGRPVISTRCGGPEDFVNEVNGILCDKEDPEKLAAALKRMIETYPAYSTTSLREFAALYTPEKIVDQLLNVYNLVLLQ